MSSLLILAPEYPHEFGGIQIYSHEVAKQFHQRGWKVEVHTQASSLSRPQDPFEVHADLVLREYRDLPRLRSALKQARHVLCTNYAYAWVGKHHPSVFVSVHGNDFTSPYFLTGGRDYFTRWLGRGQRYDFALNQAFTRQMLSRASRNVRHWFANSHYTLNQFHQRHPTLSKNKLSVAGIGLPDRLLELAQQKRERTDHGRTRPHWVTVARMQEETKNHEGLLRAYALLRDHVPFRASFVGDGPLRASLESLAHSLQLEDCVTFHGNLPQEQLEAILREADLFVLTPWANQNSYEGFGIVFLEANAFGIPALSTRVGGIPEAIQEGISGFFADSPEPAAIAEALRRFVSGDVSFSSDQCQQHARKHDWKHVVDHMETKMKSEV